MTSRRAALEAILIAGWLVAATAADAACTSSGWVGTGSLCNGCTYQGSMSMARNQTCEHVYSGPPPYVHRQAPIEFLGNRVTRRAKHGIAGVHGNTFAYAPSKGYSGQDDFTVEVNYRQGNNAGKFFVHWAIVVQ